jgi:hypothetical protein
MLKSLWASVQGDPVFMRRVNGWLAIFWVAMIPVSGHWSAWQAARVEVTQEAQAKAQAAVDVPGDVVKALVAETTIEPAPAEGTA